MCLAVHGPHETTVRVVRLCNGECRAQRAEELNAGFVGEGQLQDVAGVQVGKFALILTPPVRLGLCGKAGEDADRHFLACAEPDGLVDRLRQRRGKELHDRRRKLKIGVVHQRRVGDGDVAADHEPVHGELPEVDVQFVQRIGHFRPDRLRRNADHIQAGRAAEHTHGAEAQELGFLIGQVAQDGQEAVRDAQLAALDAAALRAQLAHALQEVARVLAVQQRVALLIGETEPAAVGIAHVVVAPFVFVSSRRRVACGRLCRRRCLRSLQAADLFVDRVDLALHAIELGGVARPLLLKRLHGGFDDTALFLCLRRLNVARQLRFTGGEAVPYAFQSGELRLERCELAAQHQYLQCHLRFTSNSVFHGSAPGFRPALLDFRKVVLPGAD